MLMLACFASLLITVSAGDSAPAAPRPLSQLIHTRWTATDGAPTEIRALAQTADGYLWIGTLSGVVRFDGVRFVPLAAREADTLPGGGVRSLLAAHDTSLWIVWRSGAVTHLHAGRMTSYGERDGLPATNRLAESSTGALVAATVTGLFRLQDGTWKDAGREWVYPGTECWSVWFDSQDALWAETERRVVYLPAGSTRFVDPGMPLLNHAGPADFAEARDGAVWMAELQRLAHTIPRLNDRRPVSEVAGGGLALLIDRRGSLWFGTVGDGLFRVLDPTRIGGRRIENGDPARETFTEKDGLLSDVILALLEDREGNIWVGSSRGLERFREGAFRPIATPGSVRSRVLFHTRDSSVWTAAYNVSGVLRLGSHSRETIPNKGFTMVTSLFQDASGVFWTVGDTGIYRLNGDRVVHVPLRRSDARHLLDITIDPAGTVWVFDGTLGLLRLSGDSLVQVATRSQPSYEHVWLFSDRAGNIWVGEPQGPFVFDHGQVHRFAAASGDGPAYVNGFFEDRTGGIWATADGGLSKLAGGRFRTVFREAVYGMAEDDVGAWWLATREGVLRLPPGEADRALADAAYRLRSRRFDQQDGLPGIITKGNSGTALTRSADGRIWVATDSGLATVDPRVIAEHLVAPAVLIETVRIDGRELAPAAEVIVPSKSADLEIDYTATSLAIPERVRFRYQLDGTDQTWRDVGTRRRAYYSSLPPGAHRFRVAAGTEDGVWNESGAELVLRVRPMPYQTWWFRSGVVLLIGALGAAAAALIQRRRHLAAQLALRSKYEATLAERARIAQELHDTLLQGFAGVTLQLKAAELALPEQPDVAAETIDRVQRLARESLREARERVWDLRESQLGQGDLPTGLETLARERTAGTGMEVSVSIRGERRRLPAAAEEAAFRIGREAIANAVQHAAAHRLEIHMEFSAHTFRLEVRDDGRGFTATDVENARSHGHFGLGGARERAARAGGRCDVLPRPGGGTIVAVELPLAE